MKKLLLLLAAVVCISTTASAQDKGDWAIMPRINIYTAWDADTVFGIGAAARYNVLDQLRLEPALTLLCHDGCSIDLNCDVHYLFPVADRWNLYPLAGISVNDFGDWSAGIHLGAGFDYAVADLSLIHISRPVRRLVRRGDAGWFGGDRPVAAERNEGRQHQLPALAVRVHTDHSVRCPM